MTNTELEAPQNVPFLRQLATSDPETRTQALTHLRSYLTAHSLFTSIDLLKLWKGLFFSMWMCDTSLAQQRFAVDLSDLISILKKENLVPFLDAFWKTMAREWGGIDKLRMDKFLYLMRRYLGVMFGKAVTDTEREDLNGLMKVLTDTPLNVEDQRLPNGLRYHVLDIYVDELEKACGGDTQNIDEEIRRHLIVPVQELAEKSPTKSVQKRAQDTLDDERVKPWLPKKEDVDGNGNDDEELEDGTEDQNGDDAEWGGIDDH